MRLDKALSLAGYTRSEARKIIARGRVQVDGRTARDAGMNVELGQVLLDGAPLPAQEEIYLMLNKPAGVVTATEDARLPTVVSLLPQALQRRKIGPVGRLDRDVTGLVLLTTDGQLAHRLISPRWKAEKCYRARCEGPLSEADVRAFAAGVALSDFTAQPAQMQILESGETSRADVILTEGKFHQVKRMFAAIGHPLIELHRRRIGCVTLDETLEPGQYRLLTDAELACLRAITHLDQELKP